MNRFIFAFVFLFSSLSWANYYKQGRAICGNFEEVKQNYESDPKDTEWQMVYAECLIIKGEVTGDQAIVQDGLARLNWLVDHLNDVPSAFFLGAYYETDGTFDKKSYDHIDKAIHYYLRTLELISLYPEYPWEPYYRVWEEADQMEIKANYYVPMFYLKKFIRGVIGSYTQALLESETYTGDRDLNTYPEHSPYTESSLREVVEHANFCLSLPLKPHFDPNRYPKYKKACQVLKDMALKLQSMEEERLYILAQNHCRVDLENSCPEYHLLADEMKTIIISGSSETRKLLNPPD